jgi:hypothetical protein
MLRPQGFPGNRFLKNPAIDRFPRTEISNGLFPLTTRAIVKPVLERRA